MTETLLFFNGFIDKLRRIIIITETLIKNNCYFEKICSVFFKLISKTLANQYKPMGETVNGYPLSR